MSQCIEYTEQNQACRANGCKQHTQPTEHFLEFRCVCDKSAIVSEPAFRQKRGIEEDRCNYGACDEKWLEGLGAYIGNICDFLLGRVHGWVVRFSINIPVDEKAHQHTQPAEG